MSGGMSGGMSKGMSTRSQPGVKDYSIESSADTSKAVHTIIISAAVTHAIPSQIRSFLMTLPHRIVRHSHPSKLGPHFASSASRIRRRRNSRLFIRIPPCFLSLRGSLQGLLMVVGTSGNDDYEQDHGAED